MILWKFVWIIKVNISYFMYHILAIYKITHRSRTPQRFAKILVQISNENLDSYPESSNLPLLRWWISAETEAKAAKEEVQRSPSHILDHRYRPKLLYFPFLRQRSCCSDRVGRIADGSIFDFWGEATASFQRLLAKTSRKNDPFCCYQNKRQKDEWYDTRELYFLLETFFL